MDFCQKNLEYRTDIHCKTLFMKFYSPNNFLANLERKQIFQNPEKNPRKQF